MTESEYKQALINHDWYYERSDDNRAYMKGERERALLVTYAKNHPWFNTLYEHAYNQIFENNQPIEPFPTKPGADAGPSETPTPEPTTPEPTTPMKEILNLVFTTLIQPLIDAIDRLGATVAYNVNPASVKEALPPKEPPAASSDDDAPAPAARRGRKAAAEKPAEAPAPAASSDDGDDLDAAPAAPAVTLDDLKAHAKTLTKEVKESRLRPWMIKNLGVQTLGECKPENYGDVLAAMKKLGATDSRAATAPADDDV